MKIIIIGAGIAGMTAGIYGQINGIDTQIFEMHNIPGGECTGWDRGEYHFDGCIHWLMGTKPSTKLNRLWKDTGALDDSVKIINHDIFGQYELDGRTVKIYRDVDKLERHLLEISPEDKKLIVKTCKAIRAFSGIEMPIDKPMDMMTAKDGIKMAASMFPALFKMRKYSKITAEEFSKKFKDPLLKMAFKDIVPPKYHAASIIMTLAGLNDGDNGWPEGGSLELSKRMEKRYTSLGGKIFYNSKVEKVLVQDGKATGIKLSNGDIKYADYVISCADGHYTLYDMLGGKYIDKKMNERYNDRNKYPVYTTSLIFAGVNCDLSDYPHSISKKLSKGINGGGINNDILMIKHYCYDKKPAPSGKSVLCVMLYSDYDWWNEKYKDKKVYRDEKKRITNEVLKEVEQRFPLIKGKIENIEMATPMTYVRYCNAWRGSWMSWMTTPESPGNDYMPGKFPGLDNFYMAGQWTMPPGGLPTAAVTGRFAIHRLCINNNREFKTS